MTYIDLMMECIAYFQKSSAFEKLLCGFREKFRGLGHWGGSVVLKELSRDEKEALGGFMGKDYLRVKDVRITAAQMEKALKSTRFDKLDWSDILEAYFGEPLISRQEALDAKEEQQRRFFKEIPEMNEDGEGQRWLKNVLETRSDGYGMILQGYREDPLQLKENLQAVIRAANRISQVGDGENRMLLAVFAAEITSDPHAFDEGAFREKLLRIFLQNKTGLEKPDEMTEAEYKRELYYHAGIIKDEVSNDVLAYGIRGWDRRGNCHEGLDGFGRRREPVRITLRTMADLERISGMEPYVYIVENPAVFSALIVRYPEKSFVCSSGQLNLATYIMLDKLSVSAKLYYAGDYDPEGLLIAQNLKQRYGAAMMLWNYDVKWYEKYRVDTVLKEPRIKKLKKVVLPELRELKEAMQRFRTAAYQEAMLGEYVIQEN